MESLLLELTVWLRETAVSHFIREVQWVWALCESLHFVGLALLLGTAGFFDLRLMGWFRDVPVAAAKSMMPVAMAGFLLNLATGMCFLVGAPEQYALNPAWWLKVASLGLAGLNAAYFETRMAAAALAIPAGGETTTPMKLVGGVSLLSWLAVLYWGRMLPFIGTAF